MKKLKEEIIESGVMKAKIMAASAVIIKRNNVEQ
jgi:hypothetical protein